MRNVECVRNKGGERARVSGLDMSHLDAKISLSHGLAQTRIALSRVVRQRVFGENCA